MASPSFLRSFTAAGSGLRVISVGFLGLGFHDRPLLHCLVCKLLRFSLLALFNGLFTESMAAPVLLPGHVFVYISACTFLYVDAGRALKSGVELGQGL